MGMPARVTKPRSFSKPHSSLLCCPLPGPSFACPTTHPTSPRPAVSSQACFNSPWTEQPGFAYLCTSSGDWTSCSVLQALSQQLVLPKEIFLPFIWTHFWFSVTCILKNFVHTSHFFISLWHHQVTELSLDLTQYLRVHLYCTMALSPISCVATGRLCNLSVPVTSSLKQNGNSKASYKFYRRWLTNWMEWFNI